MVVHDCPSFLWTHGPASLTHLETGEELYSVAVVAAGSATDPLPP